MSAVSMNFKEWLDEDEVDADADADLGDDGDSETDEPHPDDPNPNTVTVINRYYGATWMPIATGKKSPGSKKSKRCKYGKRADGKCKKR